MEIKGNLKSKVTRFFKSLYTKLFRINDSPRRVASGFAMGVFCGLIPGMGPIAALTLALFLRANKAGALFGALLTNTWLSFVILIPAIKIGSGVLNINWQEAHSSWGNLMHNFRWQDLLKLSILKIAFPVIIGYIIIGFVLALLAYLAALILIKVRKNSGGADGYQRADRKEKAGI